MNNLKILFRAYKEKRITKISEKMYKFDEHIVTRQIKKGRSILTCDCFNHSKFPNEALCIHKEGMLFFPIFEHYTKKIKDAIHTLEINKDLKENKLSEDEIIQLIKDIRDFRWV